MAEIDFGALQDYFETGELEWRIQQAGEKNGRVWAICVPYVTNRAIQARLDAVVGPGGWRNEYHPGPGGGVLCGLSIRVNGEWVTKWDGAENTGVEGVKGGLSAAMKRAAVQWGIGRYLYALDDAFGAVHENGRFRGKTKDGKSFRWDPPQLPASVLPRRGRAADVHPAGEMEQMLEFVRTAGAQVQEAAELRLHGERLPLKTYVREHWADIKEQPRVARAVVEAIEHATGARFGGGREERRAA